ncbi:MAG: hypothetical protein ACRC3H_04350 [Lachnospiraceae bacterium]
MISQKDNYKAWVRDNVVWSKWAKPVLFMGRFRGYVAIANVDVSWVRSATAKTMVINHGDY